MEPVYPRPYVARNGDRELTHLEARLSRFFAERDFTSSMVRAWRLRNPAKVPTESKDLGFLSDPRV